MLTLPTKSKGSWYNNDVIRESNDSKYTAKTAGTKEYRLKLDQIMRILFKLSKKVTLNMINHMFNEKFTSDDVDIQYENSEFVNDHFDRISGDLFIRITFKSNLKKTRYHIEFQTLNDSSMVFRMFRYGFEKAIEGNNIADLPSPVIDFPRQLAIFLEENANIDDFLKMVLRLPGGEEVNYKVPVMKYWTYSADDLKQQKLYALLPLQVFKHRKAIRSIYNSSRSIEEKRLLITGQFNLLKETIQQTIYVLGDLHSHNEIFTGDLERILRVLQNISEYLYKRYGQFQMIEKEVHQMIKTLYDPHVEQEGIKKGIKKGKRQIAKRLLNKGMSVEEVAEITDLAVEEIEKWDQS